MRITTLAKNYFSYFILVLSLLGYHSTAYSQCPTVANAAQSFCDTQSPTIADLVATNNGGGIKWYATSTSTTALASTTALQNGEDYFADDNTGSCGARQSTVVTIYSAPIADPFQGPCVENLSDATLQDFVAIGNNIQWYAASTGGSPLPITTVIVNGTLYYASQTNPNTGCETSRRAVRAVVGYVPTPTGDPIQNFCNVSGAPPTVANLVASGNNNWYLNSFSSVPLSLSTTLIDGHTYYATTIDPPCESTNRFAVLVNILQPNNAGSNGQRGICADQIASTPPFDLFNLLGGTPDNTGVWTGPIATSNGAQGTLDVSTMTQAGSPYVFTYTVSNAACAVATSTVTITINPQPTVTVTSPAVCSSSPATVTATPSPAGTYTYVWTVPSGATDPGNVATFTTTVAGTYSVVATNTTTSCSSVATPVTVVINPVPNVTVTSPQVCVGTPATVTATPNPAGTYTYVWTVPSGATNPGNVATFTTNIAGVYSVVVTDANTTCVSQPAQTTVVINPIPTVTVTSPPVCSGTPATVTATPNPAGTYSYVWTVPSGATDPGNVASFTTNIAGVYSVIATNTTSTCPSQPSQTTVVINTTPTVTVTSPPVCAGTSATVTAVATPAGTYTYVWTVPSGATDPGNVATFNTAVAGTYSVVATNTTTSCPSTSTATTVVINPIPTVVVTSPPVCAGTPATVTATPNPVGTYTYVWTVPSGAVNPGNVDTFTTNIAGVYSVIATNTTTTCPSQPAQTTVVINPIPTVIVTSPPVCTGTLATVTATPTPAGTYDYIWTVPSGATDPGNVASFTTNIAGVYSVIATNSTSTCPSLPSQTTVVINQTPTVAVTSPPVCAGTPATVTATPSPAGTYTYVWTVPSGASNPGNVATFTTNIAGVYSVIAINTTTSCPSQPTPTTVVINPTPTVIVTSPPVCTGTLATVTATPTPSGTYTYVWTVPSGANDPGDVASFTTNVAGVYSVVITDTTTTCPSQPAQTTVVINPIPTVTVTTPPICSGATATVTATVNPSGSYTYVWTVPSGATDPGNVATFTTTIAGVYSVVATSTTTTCQSQPAQATVVINPIPTVIVTSPAVCFGASTTVTATPNPAGTYSYAWTVPTGVTNPGNVDTFTTITEGVYSVVITDTATTCPSQPAQVIVVINPIPVVTVTSPPVCSGTLATVTTTINPAGTYTYVWTVPAGVPDPGNVATFTTTVAGIYSVTATNDTTTCPSQPAQTIVEINPIPTVTVDSLPVCAGTPAIVTATPNPSGTYTYTWTVPSGATNPGNVATFATTIAGVYSVVITDTVTTCSSQPAQTTVVINPIPTVTVTSPAVCEGTPATVTALVNPVGTYSYVWTVPSGASDPGDVATFTTIIPGVYSVVVTDIAATCTSQPAQTTVVINPAPNAGDDAALPVCSNQNPIDLFPLLGINAQPGGTWTDPSNAVITNILNPATAVSGNYTYTVAGIAPCPDDTATISITVTQGPEAGVSGPFAICANSAPYDLFLQLGVNAQPGGVWSPTLSGGSGFFDPAIDLQGDYTYTLTGVNPCDNDQATITVTITPVPDAGTDGSTTVCSNGIPVDLFTYLGGTPQTGGVWTDASNAVVSNMFDPTVSPSGVFTYTVVGGVGCTPATASVTITVQQSPVAGADGGTTVCIDNSGLDLINLLDGTQGVGVFSDDDSTGALSGTIFNPSAVTPGVYHFTYTVSGGAAPCTSDTALVTVTVIALPNAGTFVPGTPVCSAVGTYDLNTLLQNADPNGLWYDINDNEITNPVDVSTFLPGTYTYYYVVDNSCGSSNPTYVTFDVLPTPVAGANGSTTVCIDNSGLDLINLLDGTQGAGTFADDDSTGALTGSIFNPSAVAPGVYHFTYTVPGGAPSCAAATAIVTVTVIALPNAGTFVPGTPVCSAVGTYDLNILLQNADPNGVWYDINDNAITNPVDVSTFLPGTYTYYYVVDNSCGSSNPTYVTFDVLPTPVAGANGSTTVCIDNTGLDLINLLDGTQGTGTFADDDSTGALTGTIFNPSAVAPGVYHFTYTVPGGAPSCTTATAIVTVTVIALPNAGTFVPGTPVCNAVGTYDLNTLLQNADPNGVWYDTNDNAITNPVDVSTFLQGTYTYYYVVDNSCGSSNPTYVTFDILPNPQLDNTNITIAPVCIATDVTLNFTGLVDGTYDLNYDLTGTNVLAGQTVTLTVTGGVASFTIPATTVPNAGTTTVTFTNIQNTTSTCQTALTNVSADIIITPLVQLDNSNLLVTGLCLGTDPTVTITNAINLPDGDYQFDYTIPTGNPTTGNSGNVTITGGAGAFTIPAAVFATVGNYDLTINSITTATGCSNTNEDATTTFSITTLPNLGTVVTISPLCPTGTLDLNDLLTGEDPAGTWTDSAAQVVTSPINISGFAAGTYTYTYSITNSCGAPTIDVQFTVLPNPQLAASNIAIPAVCIGTDVTVNLSGLVDGTYNATYDLTGSNVLTGQTVTLTVAGGAASFTLPTATVPNAGTTTLTFNTIQDTTTSCQVTLTNVSADIIINPIVQLDNTNLTVAGVCLGNAVTVTIANAVNLPDGDYQFNYTIPTGNPTTGNSGNVAIAGGNGSFTIPATVFPIAGNYAITINSIITATGCSNTNEDTTTNFTIVTALSSGTANTPVSLCTSTGVLDLATLLTGEDSSGTWTDSNGQAVTSPINILLFNAGTYTYTYTVTNACGTNATPVQFTILQSPTLTTLNVTAPSICGGAIGVVNFNSMTDGVYTVNYDLGGANPLAGQQATVTIVGGTGNFIIPAANLTNLGTTIISFTNITNTANGCFTLLGFQTTLLIKALADIDSANVSIANVCYGNSIIVNINNATNLPDDTYQFNYSIPGATPVTGNSGNVTVIGGVGQFTVPASVFTASGNYTLTIFGIIATTGCTNANENAAAGFTLNAIPDLNGASVTAQDTCPTFDSNAVITGATVADGTYTIDYTLSGTNTATATGTVTFVSGTATLTIPGAGIVNGGATTVTLTGITSTSSTCGGPLATTLSTNFNVSTPAMPTLITDGNLFCDDDHPTIANLTANTVGATTIIWYDALTGGNAYADTDALVQGTTYYAAAVLPSGCESARLAVIADLTACDDIVIPDGFSPNNDGINDTFEINNLATLYPKFTLEIYNRYGNLVYEGNINTPNWGGTSTEGGLQLGNNLLPTGVYFFIINFNDGVRKAYQGRVYLSR